MSGRIAPAPPAEALLARLPNLLRAHVARRDAIFGQGVLDRSVKELCGRYVAEDQEVVGHADDPERFDERERAALAWTHAAVWDAAKADDALWERLGAHFTEPELVDLFYYLQWEIGHRAWLRTLDLPPDSSAPGPRSPA